MKVHDGAESQESRWRAILAKIEADGPVLMDQGSVIVKKARGRDISVLRYRIKCAGKIVHRSIYLGADQGGQLRRRVREVLESYRAQGRWLRQLPAYARLAAKISAFGRRHVACAVGHKAPAELGVFQAVFEPERSNDDHKSRACVT